MKERTENQNKKNRDKEMLKIKDSKKLIGKMQSKD